MFTAAAEPRRVPAAQTSTCSRTPASATSPAPRLPGICYDFARIRGHSVTNQAGSGPTVVRDCENPKDVACGDTNLSEFPRLDPRFRGCLSDVALGSLTLSIASILERMGLTGGNSCCSKLKKKQQQKPPGSGCLPQGGVGPDLTRLGTHRLFRLTCFIQA